MDCHECGETISEKAADCPHCGTSVRSVADEPETREPLNDDENDAPVGDENDVSPADPSTRQVDPGSSVNDVGKPTDSPRSTTDGEPHGGGEPTPAGKDDRATPEQSTGGGTEQGPPDSHGGHEEFDLEAFVGQLPLFPGVTAGVVTGVVLLAIAVVYAAMIPGTQASTLGLGALVFLDLGFGTAGHVTPALFGLFEVVSPEPAALGLLYLLPPLCLYTAAKLVVSFNGNDATTLPEAVVGGLTVLPGYLPVVVVAFLLATPEGAVTPTFAGLVVAAVVYPLVVGAVGGLAGGGLSGSERRVGTVYGFGGAFVITLGCFLATFVATVPASNSPPLLTHVLLGTLSYVAVNVFAFGGGQVIGAAGVLALFVIGLTMAAAAFVRSWRAADNDSPLRGVARGTTLAPTYFVVLGVYATLVPWLADSYIQDRLGMEFLAAAYARFIIQTKLSGIAEYLTAVLVGTAVFAVVLGAVGGGLATLLRTRIRGS